MNCIILVVDQKGSIQKNYACHYLNLKIRFLGICEWLDLILRWEVLMF